MCFAFSSNVSGIDAMGNLWEKPCIFHGVGDTVGWKSDGKKYPYFGESVGTNFPGSLKLMDFATFFNAMGNWWGNLSIPIWWSILQDGNLVGEMHLCYRKSMSTNFPGFPWVLLHFPMLWEIDGETHVFLMWWNILWDGNLNGKKHPYYGRGMGTNFPGFAHLMVFAEFSHAIGNWLENPYISHVMKSTIGWESSGEKASILWEKYEYQFPRSSP